jgi:HAE1 family hydrophobic/amphiphilic exporter-1
MWQGLFLNLLRLRTLVYLTAIACVLFGVRNAAAQTPVASPTPTPAATPSATPPVAQDLQQLPEIAPDYRADQNLVLGLRRVGVEFDQQHPLTVREAITMALTNNKEIEIARENVRISEFDLSAAKGVYEPRLTGLSYYERIKSPSASILTGPSGSLVTSGLAGSVSLSGFTPAFGGSYSSTFSSARNTTTNFLGTGGLNPTFPTNLSFSYTQPLLRGRDFDNNRRVIEIAKKGLSLTDAQFRQRAIEVITNVQRAYWDLVFNMRNLQIQRDAVRDTQTQLEHNRRMVAQGQLAPIDVVQVEAQLTTFEGAVFSALDDTARAENILKFLISEDRNASIWRDVIVPVDPVTLPVPDVNIDSAMQTALASREEVRQSDVAREINQVDQRFFRDQRKPQIDLVGSYSTVGLAGQFDPAGLNPINGLPFPPPPDTLIGGYGTSLSGLLANRYPAFRVGVQINIPLQNRTANAQLGRSLVEGQRIQTQREQLESQIQVEVRNALQAILTSEARLKAAAASRAASEQQYASERRKYDSGLSTLFLVLERQSTLTTARGTELKAQTDLNKAIAELQRATGNALAANNVVATVK